MQKVHPLTAYRKRQQPPLTKAELAALLRTSRAAITRWESGLRKIDERLLPSIVAQTGIPARELRPDLAELME